MKIKQKEGKKKYRSVKINFKRATNIEGMGWATIKWKKKMKKEKKKKKQEKEKKGNKKKIKK